MFDVKMFGSALAEKRKTLSMTQFEIAEALNLTRQAVSKYETGGSFPDISILIKISETFNITLDELIGFGLPKNEFEGFSELINKFNLHEIETEKIKELIYLIGKLRTDKIQNTNKNDFIIKIIPFLDESSRDSVICGIIEGEIDWRIIYEILPYIEHSSRILEAAVVDGALPYEVLEMINNYFLKGR